MALTSWDPNRKRRCRSTSPFDPTIQCQGEASDVSTHIEDHWAKRGDETLRWTHLGMPLANPERVKVCGKTTALGSCELGPGHSGLHGDAPERTRLETEAEQTERVMKQPFGDYDIGARVLAEAGTRHQQVGGDHYRTFRIQPWDIIDEYDLSYYAGLALKYLLRAGRKGSKLEDLKKARHVLDKMIELEEKEG